MSKRKPADRKDSARDFLSDRVVLDTAGSIIYLGTLRRIARDGFFLEDADVHDRGEGHATKELYVCEAREHGLRPNRRSVFVFRSTVISMSRLSDVIID